MQRIGDFHNYALYKSTFTFKFTLARLAQQYLRQCRVQRVLLLLAGAYRIDHSGRAIRDTLM